MSCPQVPFSYFTCASLRSGEGKCVRQSRNLTGRRLEKTFVDQLFVSEQIKITKSENFDVCGSVILSTTGLRSIGQDERK